MEDMIQLSCLDTLPNRYIGSEKAIAELPFMNGTVSGYRATSIENTDPRRLDCERWCGYFPILAKRIFEHALLPTQPDPSCDRLAKSQGIRTVRMLT